MLNPSVDTAFLQISQDYLWVTQARWVLKPKHLWAFLSRGSAYNKTEQYKLAISDFTKVLQFDPKNQEAYNNRGWAKKFSGNKDGACIDWKRSKKMGNAEAKIILKNNKCK